MGSSLAKELDKTNVAFICLQKITLGLVFESHDIKLFHIYSQ